MFCFLALKYPYDMLSFLKKFLTQYAYSRYGKPSQLFAVNYFRKKSITKVVLIPLLIHQPVIKEVFLFLTLQSFFQRFYYRL